MTRDELREAFAAAGRALPRLGEELQAGQMTLLVAGLHLTLLPGPIFSWSIRLRPFLPNVLSRNPRDWMGPPVEFTGKIDPDRVDEATEEQLREELAQLIVGAVLGAGSN